MSNAIFTFKSLSEMSAKLTEHPVRGVQTGDIGILIGNNTGDTVSFRATVKDSPVTNLPFTVKSDDDKVEWESKARTFVNGGIPSKMNVEIAAQPSLVPGWQNDLAPYLLEPGVEGPITSASNPIFWDLYSDGKVWGVSGFIIMALDSANNFKPEFYDRGVFPDVSGDDYPRDMGFALCKLNGLIHYIGGEGTSQTHHHTFDTSNQTMSINNKAPLPTAMRSLRVIDDSLNSGKLVLIQYTAEYNVWHYDVAEDDWTEMGPTPFGLWGVDSSIENPKVPGEHFVVDQNGGLQKYVPATDTWTPLAGSPDYPDHSQLMYNYATDELLYLDGDNCDVYDIALDSWYTINDYWEGYFTTYGAAHVGNNYYYIQYEGDEGIIYLYSPNKGINLIKD